MGKMGYRPFTPNGIYLQSDMRYDIASFQNRESDPLIYKVSNEKGEEIKIWNAAQKHNNPFTYKWPEEEIIFFNSLFINADSFVVKILN